MGCQLLTHALQPGCNPLAPFRVDVVWNRVPLLQGSFAPRLQVRSREIGYFVALSLISSNTLV